MQNIKKYFMTLALLLTAVTGAWAQSTEPTEWELTSQDGKTWTLAEMPANNIELQVEYYTESNLFLSEDALKDKANISVTAGELGVQFGEDGKSADPVTEGTKVDIKYNGAKKILGMKVEKKAAGPVVGQVIGSDGKNYDANATLPTGVTAVAMIAYVGSDTGVEGYTHGLALALTDEASTMNWTTATGASGAAAHTPAAPTPMTSSWMLPSRDQWKKMIDACKNVLGTKNNYQDLRDGFSGISGASNLQSGSYWSSTEYDAAANSARAILFGSGLWGYSDKGDGYTLVRACLAF